MHKPGIPGRLLKLLAVGAIGYACSAAPVAATPDSVLQFTGRAPELQRVLDDAPEGALVVCNQTEPLENCEFFDGSKDGIMVTPEEGAGDIVGGFIRNVAGTRMGRDLVSLSGGCLGQRVRDITVEHVRLVKGYYRGAVEVSDGSDNITVRHLYAEEAVYAVDVQDHGARRPGQSQSSAPNTNITLEDVAAVNCRHLIRTANHPLGHRNLSLRNFAGTNCLEPVLIANTTQVRVQNLTLRNTNTIRKAPIILRGCDNVEIRNLRVIGLEEGVEAVASPGSTDVKIEGPGR